MSGTAVVTVQAASGPVQVTVPTATDSASNLERHNAIAKAIGAPPVARPSGPVFGPEGITPGTANEYARREASAPGAIAGKAPPPNPAQLEAANRAKLADFDKEMQAKGIQRTSQARDASGKFAAVPADQVDTAGIEAVNAAYRALTPAERLAKRAQYETELAEFYQGRRLSETRADFRARMDTGAVSAPAAEYSKPGAEHTRDLTDAGKTLQKEVLAEFSALTPAEQNDARDAYNAALVNLHANEHGMVPVAHFNPATLHGYTLPRLVPDQHYSASLIHDLKWARDNGITQAQLDAYVTRGMRELGLIK